MSKRTEISEADTNFTDKPNEGGSSSFVVNKKRQMFIEAKNNDLIGMDTTFIIQEDNIKLIPKNVLLCQPKIIRSINWPQVFMPDQQTYVTLKGNFYSIKDSRNKQKFINRKSKPNSETLYFNVQKNGQKLIISSVQKFLSKENTSKGSELFYYFHLAILNIQTDHLDQYKSIQKGFSSLSSSKPITNNVKQKKDEMYFLQFKGIQLIDNYKKAFAIFQPLGRERNSYQICIIDFCKKQNNNNQQNSSQIRTKNQSKIVGKAYLERKQSQNYIKLINSQYGDIALLITSQQIYQIEIAGQFKPNQYSLILKPLVISKIFSQNKNTYISNQTNQLVLSKQIFKKQQSIIDAQYIMNGIKIMVLTSQGRIFVIQSQQCMFSESLYQVLSHKQMVQNYNLEHFVFRRIYFLRGFLVIQVQSDKNAESNLVKKIRHEFSILEKLGEVNNLQNVSRGLLIAKVQSNSLSFSKFIELPFELKNYFYFKVHLFKEADQILLQVMNQKDQKTLELHRCQILSNKNNFIPFAFENYIRQISININSIDQIQTKQINQKILAKICFGKSNKTIYSLKGNIISSYRIYSNQFSSNPSNQVKKNINLTFFQKPLKVVNNPLTGFIIVLFKQFVKFFINSYSQLKLFYVMNIRNVCDVSFSKYGQYILLCTNDNSIYLIDSFKFQEKKIMQFYGDIKEAQYNSQYILTVRSTKNNLNIFKKKQNPEAPVMPKGKYQAKQYFDKLYQIKIETDDIYHVDENNAVVLKKDGTVEFYSHIPQNRSIKSSSDEKQMIRLNILLNYHSNLINKKKFLFEKGEFSTYLFYSSQFSTLFVGTNFGNVRQYLYPFLSIQDPSPPMGYKLSVANTSITHIQINGDFSSLYVITQLGQIIELQIIQFLNGLKKNAIYTLSKVQIQEKKLKYEYANRSYLLDQFTTIEQKIKNALTQQYDEVLFIDDKLKDDIEDITTKIKDESNKQTQKISKQKKYIDKEFKDQFDEISLNLKSQQNQISNHLEELMQKNQKIKDDLIQKYEKQLLEIYKENDRLTSIKGGLLRQYQEQKHNLRAKLSNIVQIQQEEKEKEGIKLQAHYLSLGGKYQTYKKTTMNEIDQNKEELDKYKQVLEDIVNTELKEEEAKKQAELSKISKIQKEIQKFKKRSIYFQNLIVETNNQIQQLQSDISLYSSKKQLLQQQLNQKEKHIQEKQRQIIGYLKNTNQMKKVKSVHQFELQQYEQQIFPIQGKIKQLQKQVQKMNFQIMQQFDSKVQQNSIINNSNKRILKLKNKIKDLQNQVLSAKTQFLRLTESLEKIVSDDPFSLNIKSKLGKIIDVFSTKNQTFVPNQGLQKAKKQGQKLMRKKNILRKAIQQQQKAEQAILRNKNQFFRYYVDNTNVVNQYNQLFRDHNVLKQEKQKLEDKIASIKTQMYQTPIKRTHSLHIRKISQKKLTPFQRYQEQKFQFSNLKIKDTVQTRATIHKQDSAAFLKSLIKDVSLVQKNYEKSNLIRDRIRTFVNPQMSRKKQIQKQLFQRERGKSNHLLLKL